MSREHQCPLGCKNTLNSVNVLTFPYKKRTEFKICPCSETCKLALATSNGVTNPITRAFAMTSGKEVPVDYYVIIILVVAEVPKVVNIECLFL